MLSHLVMESNLQSHINPPNTGQAFSGDGGVMETI